MTRVPRRPGPDTCSSDLPARWARRPISLWGAEPRGISCLVYLAGQPDSRGGVPLQLLLMLHLLPLPLQAEEGEEITPRTGRRCCVHSCVMTRPLAGGGRAVRRAVGGREGHARRSVGGLSRGVHEGQRCGAAPGVRDGVRDGLKSTAVTKAAPLLLAAGLPPASLCHTARRTGAPAFAVQTTHDYTRLQTPTAIVVDTAIRLLRSGRPRSRGEGQRAERATAGRERGRSQASHHRTSRHPPLLLPSPVCRLLPVLCPHPRRRRRPVPQPARRGGRPSAACAPACCPAACAPARCPAAPQSSAADQAAVATSSLPARPPPPVGDLRHPAELAKSILNRAQRRARARARGAPRARRA